MVQVVSFGFFLSPSIQFTDAQKRHTQIIAEGKPHDKEEVLLMLRRCKKATGYYFTLSLKKKPHTQAH